MDRDEAAEDRLDPGPLETGGADHALELGHRGEAADRFDQVPVAVLVMRDGLADLWDDLVRVEIVRVLEPRPFGGRELEAEEPAAELQHAERLGQRLVDMRHVPDAESDGVGVEAPVGIGELLRVLARPHQGIDAALHRAFEPDVEHVLVDVGDGYVRAAIGHAEGDVARAARHVEGRGRRSRGSCLPTVFGVGLPVAILFAARGVSQWRYWRWRQTSTGL